jgi:hypothetical protein
MKSTTSQTSTSEPKKIDVQKVIDDQIRFEQAVERARVQQKRFPEMDASLEVSPDLFDYLASGDTNTKFLMYKDVRVFKAGTKEEILAGMNGVAGI